MPSHASSRRLTASAGEAETPKRSAVAAESGGGAGRAAPSAQVQKRVALGNISNVVVAGAGVGRAGSSGNAVAAATESTKLNSATSAAPLTEGSLVHTRIVNSARDYAVKSTSAKPAPTVSPHDSSTQKHDVHPPKVRTIVHVPNVAPATAHCSSIMSPICSGDTVLISATMSICNSMKNPNFECVDHGDSPMLASLQQRAHEDLHISHDRSSKETKWMVNVRSAMEIDQVCDADNNAEDSHLCPDRVYDMYTFLREAEIKKSPSTDFLETIQKDVTPSMRAILIDWLVEVAEEYRLVPDTLYLTVNYIDRYLSCNRVNRQRLQLLGIACMLIAAKHEEICAPHVEEFCYITDNTYFRDEVLEMEYSVLNHLKFEMSAPTAKCFLRRFIRAAQAFDEDLALHLDLLASYVAELSLLEYNLLSYRPSLIAASAIFLAKFILQPTKHPWNSTLARYTRYKPSELCNCVKVLHHLFSIGPGAKLPAIREKYSQHKYKFVAKKHCPPSIPTEFFRDAVF